MEAFRIKSLLSQIYIIWFIFMIIIIWNVDSISCPVGTVQIGKEGSDIFGCGLEECDARYRENYKSIDYCDNACRNNTNCTSFSWAPNGADHSHPQTSVCTLYDTIFWNSLWGEQVLCQPYIKSIRFSSATPAYNKYFIRHSNDIIVFDEKLETEQFMLDSSFYVVRANLAEGYISFRSVNYPDYYIRRHVNGYDLVISKYEDNDDEYINDVSFKEITARNGGNDSYKSYESYTSAYYITHENLDMKLRSNPNVDDSTWLVIHRYIPECPDFTEQVGLINANINSQGCGLETCKDRYNYPTIEDCKIGCDYNDECKSFAFAPYNSAPFEPLNAVWPLYNTSKENSYYGQQKCVDLTVCL